MEKFSILISKNCFMNCEGCYLSERTGGELPYSDILNFAEKLKEIGVRQITLSGGDPLRRAGMSEFLDELGKLAFDIHLDTTGFNINSDSTALLDALERNVNLLGIALDGSNNIINSSFRTSDNFRIDEIEEILEVLSEHKVPISINTVVHQGNLNDLQNIADIIGRYNNIVRWEIHQFAPLTNRKIDFKKYSISKEDYSQAINRIKLRSNIILSPKINTMKNNFKCLYWNGDLVLSKRGENQVLGNIKTLSLDGIRKLIK